MRIVRVLAVTAVAAMITAPALASDRKANDDPNRMICEKQEVLGTRLAAKRVCKTAAEWAAEKQQARQQIDRTQVQRSSTSGN